MQIILVRALLLLLVILVLSGCPYVSYYNSKARYLHITVDVLIIINRIYYICPLNHRYYRFVSIYWSHHLSSERRGTKTPKTTLETMIIKPKAVIKQLPWNQNCVFEIKIDLALVGNGRRVMDLWQKVTKLFITPPRSLTILVPLYILLYSYASTSHR